MFNLTSYVLSVHSKALASEPSQKGVVPIARSVMDAEEKPNVFVLAERASSL